MKAARKTLVKLTPSISISLSLSHTHSLSLTHTLIRVRKKDIQTLIFVWGGEKEGEGWQKET